MAALHDFAATSMPSAAAFLKVNAPSLTVGDVLVGDIALEDLVEDEAFEESVREVREVREATTASPQPCLSVFSVKVELKKLFRQLAKAVEGVPMKANLSFTSPGFVWKMRVLPKDIGLALKDIDRVTVEQLVHEYGQMIDDARETFRTAYNGLDFSRSQLLPNDLVDVAALLKIHFDNCKLRPLFRDQDDFRLTSVVLRNSRITYSQFVVDQLTKMLEHALHIDVTQTPFASVDAVQFFQGDVFRTTFAKRLIFIPNAWLSGRNWRSLFRNTSSAGPRRCSHGGHSLSPPAIRQQDGPVQGTLSQTPAASRRLLHVDVKAVQTGHGLRRTASRAARCATGRCWARHVSAAFSSSSSVDGQIRVSLSPFL